MAPLLYKLAFAGALATGTTVAAKTVAHIVQKTGAQLTDLSQEGQSVVAGEPHVQNALLTLQQVRGVHDACFVDVVQTAARLQLAMRDHARLMPLDAVHHIYVLSMSLCSWLDQFNTAVLLQLGTAGHANISDPIQQLKTWATGCAHNARADCSFQRIMLVST